MHYSFETSFSYPHNHHDSSGKTQRRNHYVERMGKGKTNWHSPHQCWKLRTTLSTPLPEFNKNFPPTPHQMSYLLRLPAFTSQVHIIHLVKLLCLLTLSVILWNLFLGHDKNMKLTFGLRPPLAYCWESPCLVSGAVTSSDRWKGPTARGPWDHKPLRRQNLASHQGRNLCPLTLPCLAPGGRLDSQWWVRFLKEGTT